jgi:GNAT superfamily N-acetyltransferase
LIRRLDVSELERLGEGAAEFYASSRFLEDFEPALFRRIWEELLANGAGVVFVAEKDGRIEGAIGGIVHREIYSAATVAEEMFWFAREAARGAGVALYRHLERWAKEKGAANLHMMHLADSMPEKVSRFYCAQGFELAETRYVKRLA